MEQWGKIIKSDASVNIITVKPVLSVYTAKHCKQMANWWPLLHMDRPNSSTVLLTTCSSYCSTADEASAWTGVAISLSGSCESVFAQVCCSTVKHNDQVDFSDLDMSLQHIMSLTAKTGAIIRMLFWRCRQRLGLHTIHLFLWTPYHYDIFWGWVLLELLRLLTRSSTPELWRLVFSTPAYAPKDTLGVSSGQFLKRSHGHGVLCLLLLC